MKHSLRKLLFPIIFVLSLLVFGICSLTNKLYTSLIPNQSVVPPTVMLASNQALPITNDFFTFDADDTITGYAQDFLTSCASVTNMKQYLETKTGYSDINVLDFSDKTISGGYEVLSSQKSGNANVKNFYKTIKQINFSKTKFTLFNRTATNDIFMGCYTFSGTNLSSNLDDFENVQTIIFDQVDFQTYSFNMEDGVESVHTACGLFANMNFNSLEKLVISNCFFSVAPQQIRVQTIGISITTAEDTFANCAFPSLTTLNINSNQFASADMDCDGSDGYTHGRDVSVNTFSGTFSNCKFDVLEAPTNDTGFLLNSNNTFVAPNMTAGHVSVCNSSFAHSSFAALDTLSLDNLVFAQTQTIKNKNYRADAFIYTATNMFGYCSFDQLTTLRLNATFAVADTTLQDELGKWAYGTFQASYLPALIDLYLPDVEHQPVSSYPWFYTFNDCSGDDTSADYFIAHGYSSEPDWWNDKWLDWPGPIDWETT